MGVRCAVFGLDYSKCAETCENVRMGNALSAADMDNCPIVPCGCVCPGNKVLSDDGLRCVKRNECPCRDRLGNLYEPGATMKQ